jgi:UPF0271 protein
VSVRPDTLCIHADTPGAVALAKRLRVALADKGIGVGAGAVARRPRGVASEQSL